MQVKRNELKYYIRYSDYLALSKILKNFMSPDKHNKQNGGYYIRSLYFDNLDNKAFEDKMDGIERRKKFRVRLYDLKSQKMKFEIKSKYNYSIFKESAWVTRKEVKNLQNGEIDFLPEKNNPILNKVYCYFKKEHHLPVILVDYNREAYTYPMNNIRITFDRFLKSNGADLDIFSQGVFMKPALKDEVIIMEIKYDHYLPDWIKRIIQIPRFERCAISKYCISRLEYA